MLSQAESCAMVIQEFGRILDSTPENNQVHPTSTLAQLGVDSIDALEVVFFLEGRLTALGYNMANVDLFRALSKRKAVYGRLTINSVARRLRAILRFGPNTTQVKVPQTRSSF